MSQLKKNSQLIKKFAHNLGFNSCGISSAGFLDEEAHKLDEWLARNYQGKMSYLERNAEKRLDPAKLVPGAKSVVSLTYNYYPREASRQSLKVAKYAYGEDYHFVIKRKLKSLFQRIQEEIGQIEGRVFVDSAPVHERAWAAKSGLGWVGKHSLLLNREMGSYFFLAELIIDLPLEPDGPVRDYCGTCTRCMDACPTDAIPEPYVVDGSRCISYLTIELKEEIPSSFQDKMENWIFGCDICQDVCPWNKYAQPHSESNFSPGEWIDFTSSDWTEMTREVFGRVFRKSAVKRTGYEGLMRNITFVHTPDKQD